MGLAALVVFALDLAAAFGFFLTLRNFGIIVIKVFVQIIRLVLHRIERFGRIVLDDEVRDDSAVSQP